MKQYYENTDVQGRMVEYLGGASPDTVTCQYLTAGDTTSSRHRQPQPTKDLPAFWERGLDISRSLWDSQSLIAHLDIEYVNFDYPAEPFLNAERIFDLQRPVEWVIEAVLSDYGIKPLHLLSGRGHHFVWQIAQNSRAFNRLGKLGRLTPRLETLYTRPHRPNGEPVPRRLGAAFAGLGLVVEYLAHRIKQAAAQMCKVPVELTAVEAGPTRRGREIISLDISEYGDPLSTRVIRVPFSLYLKPWQQRHLLPETALKNLPPVFLIPLPDMDSARGIRIMHDIAKVIELAGHASTKIPDHSEPMEDLISAYEDSTLKEFHDWFYSQEHEPPEKWPMTYDRTPMDPLPHCGRHILEHPNDLLLRPAGVERLVRILLSLGWHPRHIAGLIRSKFERDCHWGNQWDGYDPATRADFYTRIFSGLFAVRRDNLVDFNCRSAQEEKMCFVPDCPDNLEPFKQSLWERRNYERLACRPFHRLFLPEEHL